MVREAEGKGPTVEEAIAAALASLGVPRDEATIDVVEEPKGGFLGVGAQEAVVRAALKEAGDAGSPAASADDLEEQADVVADFLDELLARMQIDAIAEPLEHAGHMYVDIVDGPEEDLALLIGRHGQTLEAIQELTRTVVGRRLDQRVRVIVDVQDYRKRQEARLEERARDLAEEALRSGTEQELEPMNAFERKLVHDVVAAIDGAASESRGEEPQRYVVIRPA